MDDEFSPEQRLVIEVMRVVGEPNPEAIVRAERIEAYRIGAYLAPAMTRYVVAAHAALDAYTRSIGRPNPNDQPPAAAPS